ncbi:DUF7601 domain-containing protein [Mediterraneibacter faecis]|uniref:DUF7601 domain-containing protein n=1 Tax=Mediterraneibacter faecis TaxID=592978 RepID=UPI001FAC1612|nr:DUF5979 domain-containing protein [Mediterraneibacter faecis]
MRHNKWNKCLKIACSWILIFSMCFLSLNTVNASAEDTTAFESESETGDTEAFTSDTEIESEPSTDQFTSESEETKQETEKQIPDSIEVEQLNAEIQNRVANGEVPSTDRVKYVDEDGKTIEGAPTTIELGKISDHTEITIADKNYEFKNAKVSDEDCVFIGQYENYIYYSTDGNIAKKLTDEQLLVMTYSESKNSVNEEIEQVATEDTNKSEESTEQIIDNEGGTEQPEELNVPESISVQSLDEALQISVANGDENATSTDRVEYVDVNGNSIAGAPSVIQFGAIADHKDLSIEGRHFEFKSAKVDGKNCVYIGKYNDTIYYSTDGVIAIKMDDTQNLTMMYQEYYLVSIKEVIPDSCTPGTITKKNGSLDAPLDISNQIRVNAGENFIISVTPGTDTAKTNDPRAKRFIIESVVSQDGATITKENGNENKATYSINFVKDDTITITYKEQSVYRIFINTKDINGEEYINIEHSVAKGWKYLKDQDKIMWTFTPDDVYGISGYNLDIPAFHTKRGYRVIHMVVNGTSIQASSESGESEVPIKKGDSVSSDPGKLSLITQMTDSYTTTRDEEKNCSYEYKMDLKVRTGKFEDYNFTLVPYKEERGKQAVTVRLYTNQSRSGEGLDVVMWDYEKQELVPVKDNQTIEMDPVEYQRRQTRQVRIFFAKPKAGYEFVNGLQSAVGVMYGQPHGDNPLGDGKMNDANAGTIDAMTATSLIRGDNPFKIYNDQWQAAQKAAKEKGYTRYLAWGGARPLLSDNGWRLYSASFMVASSSLYVHYNSGAGMGVLPKSADVKNIPDNPETRSYYKTPMHSYGKDLETGKGTRAIGTTFIMGEGWAEPTCEGYEFIGWKLKNKDGELSQKTYSNGELFTISDENYGYANNTNLPVFASNNFTGYQIVAQWKKIDTKKVEVNHWLKVPGSTEKLGKKTSGTISFATENESVNAYAKPEANGTLQGYVFDTEDSRNELEKEVKNDSSSDTITLNLYYKPTVLKVRKTVTGYNMEPNRSYEFTIKAVPPSGTDASTATITDGQIFIRKGTDDKVQNLTFTNNKATFNLAKDEFVDISCLPTGWTYTVTETNPGNIYKTSYKLNGSDATDGRVAEIITSTTGNDEVTFTNASTVAPPETGRTFYDSEWILLLIVILVISAGGMTFLRKMKKRY